MKYAGGPVLTAFYLPVCRPIGNPPPRTAALLNRNKAEASRQPQYPESESSQRQQGLYEDIEEDGGESVVSESDRTIHQDPKPSPILESNASVSVQRLPGELRIVIDRPENDRPRTADGVLSSAAKTPSRPTSALVSTRRFKSEDGSMFLGGKRTSARESQLLSLPLENSTTASASVQAHAGGSMLLDRPSFIESMFGAVDGSERAAPTPTATDIPHMYKIKEPVSPSMFDTLLGAVDDPSMVRYIPGTKIVSAATPERIVAEISSESFMDYELVSDFFLTFRSFLSADDLLSLLLARLQWAISRWQDDGRIIRIRTFAAIRHWILNYFVDDFVPSYALRARFCASINAMYSCSKSRGSVSASDLKVLLDLKRCWYGRCSLCWDIAGAPLVLEDPDVAIVPGEDADITVSDGSQYGRTTGEVYQDVAIHVPTGSAAAARQSVDREVEEEVTSPTFQHNRTENQAAPKGSPVSADSDQRFESSILSRGAVKHLPGSPVPARFGASSSMGHQNSAAAELHNIAGAYGHAHKHSGSFSDSIRDDGAKRDQPLHASTVEWSKSGSLIRGDLYPPAESIMPFTMPPSPSLPPTDLDISSATDNAKLTALPSLGMKSIIGSIRRAMQYNNNRRPNTRLSLREKTASLPSNLVLGPRTRRDRKLVTRGRRRLLVDFLCEEALKQYHVAVASQREQEENEEEEEEEEEGEEGDAVEGSSISRRMSGLPASETTEAASLGSTARTLYPNSQTGVLSRLTSGSQSIVIVDGTGTNVPTIVHGPASGPSNEANSSRIESWGLPSHASNRTDDKRTSYPIYYDVNVPTSIPPQEPQRSDSLRRRRSDWVAAAGRSVVRKSLPSSLGLRRNLFLPKKEAAQRRTLQIELPPHKSSVGGKLYEPFGRMLRRRPAGGNLRRMRDDASFASSSITEENVQETTLEIPRHVPSHKGSLVRRESRQGQRKSLENVIAHFAEIPDDSDGGVESTLLKLEGKWKRQSGDTDEVDAPGQKENSRQLHGASGSENQREGLESPPRGVSGGVFGSQSMAASEDSYCDIPLLERDFYDTPATRLRRDSQALPVALTLPNQIVGSRKQGDSDTNASFDVVDVSDSMECIPPGTTLPQFQPESLSRSSSLSAIDPSDDQVGVEQEPTEATESTAGYSLSGAYFEMPPHPLAHPPSPPMSAPNGDSPPLSGTTVPVVGFQAPPLTPEESPQRGVKGQGDHDRSRNTPGISSDVLMDSDRDYREQAMQHAIHVPFILACESHILAQQLTLVEMAALSEIDWKDLIDMKWDDASLWTSSWVHFLFDSKRRGIDLVVGRFNLMVKWIQSEIVLVKDMETRARTISKFIHTAAHAKSICNYSTTLQICIALSSSVCSRLKKTWALVPPVDRLLLRDIEALTRPVRNFHDLREEMESANLQDGCVPFVGELLGIS